MSDDIDFFVSYAWVDAAWAEWIAWTLEKDGDYKTCIQAWDFAPGTNFVSKMHEAAASSRHTVAVLSPAYLRANFTEPEWAAAFTQDPVGNYRRLIPVMAETCKPKGLLAAIVYISLVGLDEASARDALLRGVSDRPGTRPLRPPAFPGARRPEDPAIPPTFPGPRITASQGRRDQVAQAADIQVRSLPEHLAPRPTPSDLHAPDPVPWVPLTAIPAVRWEPDPHIAAGDPETSRLELHLIPVSSGSSVAKADLSVVRNALAAVGRSNAIFPVTATVSVQTGVDHVTAMLTASAGAVEAGLRVDANGERSGWLCLPPTEMSDIALLVSAELGRLLAALISLPPALPEGVTFAAAISGRAKLQPQGWLHSRDLTVHAQQVATQLGNQLTTAATG